MKVGIILAGGAGKRLWPLSTLIKPKQFHAFFSKKSLLTETIDRMSTISNHVVIATGSELATQIQKSNKNIECIVEPSMRDTAPAILFAALHFSANDVLFFAPSDAYIPNDKKFTQAAHEAQELAQKNDGLVLIGIKPTRLATEYGYFKQGKNNSVDRFYEKPTEQLAQDYVNKGYLWNSGMLVAKAGVIVELMRSLAPSVYIPVEKAFMTKNNVQQSEKEYAQAEKISFDHAVLEKTKNISCVSADFYWNDLGSYPAILELARKHDAKIENAHLNHHEHPQEDHIEIIDGKGNIVLNKTKKKIVLIGVSDLVVAETKDALLVTHVKSLDKLKKFVDTLPKELR